MKQDHSAMRHLLGCCLCLSAVDSQTPINPPIIYGKYYKHATKDFTDNSYHLFSPALSGGISRTPRAPVIIQLPGYGWVAGAGAEPFATMSPAIAEYNSKGLAYVSMGYRAIDRRYWYDSPASLLQKSERKMEELIHVSPEGVLYLDSTGKTMADYKAHFCWLELVTKAHYDAVQGLEHLIANADKYGIDVHRIVFFSSSAGSVEVNYLTWVYHSLHSGRFTPIGMMLENPQYDLPAFTVTKPVWDYWLTHSSAKLLSELMPRDECYYSVTNMWCIVDHRQHVDHQKPATDTMSSVTKTELCNATWNKEALRLCERFSTLTIAEMSSMRDYDISPGLQKLWSVGNNMLRHQPKPFHLYVFSDPISSFFAHSGLWALMYAENAQRAGINYTVFYASYPGMIESILGPPEIRQVNLFKSYNYRSSVDWRNEMITKDKAAGVLPLDFQAAPAVPNSLTEHSEFMCYVTGLSCPLVAAVSTPAPVLGRFSTNPPVLAVLLGLVTVCAVICLCCSIRLLLYKIAYWGDRDKREYSEFSEREDSEGDTAGRSWYSSEEGDSESDPELPD